MPELPEVEIVKEGLVKVLSRKTTISEIEYYRKDLRNKLPVHSKKWIEKQPILEISRRAKYILIKTPLGVLISHLGMTGTWRIRSKNEALKAHDHIQLQLSNGKKLIYNDPRRFGIFEIVATNKMNSYRRLLSLGPEPLSADFTAEYLFATSRGRKIPIKSFLMDQKIVVGVGNIYVCEALFFAKISPLIEAQQLTLEMSVQIVKEIKEVLQQSIDAGGSSINDYSSVEATKGSFQKQHQVYGRKNQSCHKCSELIQVKVISGRSTFWCVNCQKGSNNHHERPKNNTTRKTLSSPSGAQGSGRQHRKIKR
jgi:formamidopyrimidine-DNA glycosylase